MIPNKRTFRQAIGLAALAVLVTACGGGSSGGGQPGAETTSSISGTAVAPAGTVARLERGLLDRFAGVLLGEAVAAVTGLDPVGNAEVELVRLNDDGTVAEVIATAETTATGVYSFALDNDVALTGDLAVRIAGNDTELRAQVTGSEDVRIDPVSELVLRKLITARARLADLGSDAVVALRGKVDELDIDLGAVADLEAAIAEVDAVAGDTLQADARNLAEGEGDAATVEGDWNRIFVARELAPNTTAAEEESSAIGLVAGDGDALTAEIGPATLDRGFTDGNGTLDYETETSQADTVDSLSVTGAGTIVVENPLEEVPPTGGDPNGNYTVFPAQTTRIATANGIGVGIEADTRLQYGAEDSDGDGTADTRGTLEAVSQGMGLNLFGRAQSGASGADLVGEWGFVRNYLELEAAGGRIESNSINITVQENDGGNGYEASFTGYNFAAVPLFDGASSLTESPDTGDVIPLMVDGGGSLTVGTAIDGFVADGDNVLAAAGLVEETSPDLVAKTSLIGVRKPSGTVDLDGRSFRYFGYLTEVNGNSITHIQQSDGELAFDSGTISATDITERRSTRETIGGEAVVENEAIAALFEDVGYMIDSDKRIVVDGATVDGDTSLDLFGFVAADYSLVVLAVAFDDTTAGAGTGLIIGLPSD